MLHFDGFLVTLDGTIIPKFSDIVAPNSNGAVKFLSTLPEDSIAGGAGGAARARVKCWESTPAISACGSFMACQSVNMDARSSLLDFILICESVSTAPHTSLEYTPVASASSPCAFRTPVNVALCVWKSMCPSAMPALTVRMQVALFRIQCKL